MDSEKNSHSRLVGEIRRKVSSYRAANFAAVLGTKEAFRQSQQWPGFAEAFDSWHSALWRWVDEQTPPDLVERLNGTKHDWETLCPQATPEERQHDEEVWRQEYLLRRTWFLSGLKSDKAQDPAWYEWWGRGLCSNIAGQLGDDQVHQALAQMKQRKPARDQGDRQLKYGLLFSWIAGCLWAVTTNGVAAFLQAKLPRSVKGAYDEKTISDAQRSLKLHRLARPNYWGFRGEPPQLVPLR
jgi:hypothetical protein